MKSSFKVPDTTLLILLVLAFFAALTWIIPGGSYQTREVGGRTVVVPGSFEYVEAEPTSLGKLVQAPFRGMTDPSAIQIITFIFIVAGAFSIIEATGATTSVIQRTARFFQENPKYDTLFIPAFMMLFSLMGATFGMSEEVIIFIPLFVSLSRALGYDTIVGVAVPFLGAGAGFAGAITNPFTIAIAQGIAEVQPLSGTAYRMITLVAFTLAVIVLVQRYANSIKNNISDSIGYEDPDEEDSAKHHQEVIPFTLRRKLVLLIFSGALGVLIYGVIRWDWYIAELSALFLVLGIASAVVGGIEGNVAVNSFLSGMKSVIGAAVVVALSKAILLILSDAKIIDTILHHLSMGISGWPAMLSAQLMLLVQTLINTIVPSGSGQAALTIPIMAPLGDLIGITRQTVVLIFQFGDGITNLIIPTSGVTMGVLGMAKLPWEVWARWLLPKLLVLYALAMIFVSIAVLIGFE